MYTQTHTYVHAYTQQRVFLIMRFAVLVRIIPHTIRQKIHCHSSHILSHNCVYYDRDGSTYLFFLFPYRHDTKMRWRCITSNEQNCIFFNISKCLSSLREERVEKTEDGREEGYCDSAKKELRIIDIYDKF